ncbi:hypothetical protein ACSQ67_011474 [Phaseolus vulgaris]
MMTFLGESIKDLVPTVDYTKTLIQELPMLLVQVTSFLGHEAFSIGVAICHVLVDGVAAVQFINSWAKLARGETLEPHEMPFLDRTVLRFIAPPSPPRFDHLEFKPFPLILGRCDNTAEKNKVVKTTLLKLTAEQVRKLKNKANADESTKGSRPYSRFEAIAAHVWRSACKARGLDENQPNIVRFGSDIRNRLIPPLPRNYFGNAMTLTVASSQVGEILSNSLGHAAKKIREAIEVLTHEYISSQMPPSISRFNATTLFRCAAPFRNANRYASNWTSILENTSVCNSSKVVRIGDSEIGKSNLLLQKIEKEVESLSETHDLCIGGDCIEMSQQTSATLLVIPHVKILINSTK